MDAVGALAKARRVVVKVGSALVIDPGEHGPARARIASIAADVAALRKRGVDVAIVTSGAIALGQRRLSLGKAPRALDEQQACAAAGQSSLMGVWEDAFALHGAPVAQALLTPDDTERRRRWLNARATLERLFALNAIPVINENDTVATDEIRYGDNDRLAARVAQMITADVLALLSDVDGLYDGDPRTTSAARHIPVVDAITPDMERRAGPPGPGGAGGMGAKLAAAKIAARAGCATIIADGRPPHPLQAILDGARTTLFRAAQSPASARKAWIAGRLDPQGTLVIDAGAARALRNGKSLLAAGLTDVRGAFAKGDAVVVAGPDNAEIARGLVAYDAGDARRIAGRRSADVAATLGYAGRPEVVHRDHLALTEAEPKE